MKDFGTVGREWHCRSKRRHAEMKVWRAFFASPPFWCFSAHLSFRITGLFRLDVWTGGQHACEARLDASFPSVFHFYDFFIFLYLFIMVVCHSMSSLFLYLCLPAHWGPTGCKQICPVRLCCILKKSFFYEKYCEIKNLIMWSGGWIGGVCEACAICDAFLKSLKVRHFVATCFKVL